MAYEKTVPAWMQQVTDSLAPGHLMRSSDVCDGPACARAVYGEHLPPGSGLTAFAYLWRRFGPPWWGSDNHKDLVGYLLGMPHPEVFLRLSLSASRLDLAVGYYITAALWNRLQAPVRDWERACEAW